jgi:hypothetical protein
LARRQACEGATSPVAIFAFKQASTVHLKILQEPLFAPRCGMHTKSSSDGSRRRLDTPSAETAAMLFRTLLASGQVGMRKVDGWRTLAKTSIAQPIDLAA